MKRYLPMFITLTMCIMTNLYALYMGKISKNWAYIKLIKWILMPICLIISLIVGYLTLK